MNEFNTSTLKKKESVIISFFKIALENGIFRFSLGCIVTAMIMYAMYRLRHVIGRAWNTFATWLNSLNFSVMDFATIIFCIIIFVVFCIFCVPEIIGFFRQTARRACILSRAPLSVEEMKQIGATTQLEYCLAMACYLLDYGIISFSELTNERTAARNNPLLQTEQWYYHAAISEYKDDGPVSPVVRQWCINIMKEHNILDSFLHIYNETRYENAKYIHSLLFPNKK